MDRNDITAAIAGLTAKGREAMTIIGGNRRISFFDDGVVEGSGSWGECLTGDLGHRSSGVINRLAKVGMFDTSKDYNGTWFSLTALGAAVAQELALEAAHAEALEVHKEWTAAQPVAESVPFPAYGPIRRGPGQVAEVVTLGRGATDCTLAAIPHHCALDAPAPRIPEGTEVTVSSRKGITGTVVKFVPATTPESNFGMGDLYLVDFGGGRTGYNTPDQVEELGN